MNLSLVDQGLLVGVNVLDRVLDRQDVAALRLVDPVDECREGGRLAAARGTRDENQALGKRGDLPEALGQPDVRQVRNLVGHQAQDGGGPLALVEEVRSEPAELGVLVAEVDLADEAELSAPLWRGGEDGAESE